MSAGKVFPKGTKVGPYSVVRVLGQGAFGVVYEAHKQPLGKRIALKVLRDEHSEDGGFVARFVKEARAAASIKHPHIVEVDDAGTADGVVYLAMEFLEGESLAERIDRAGRMPLSVALDLFLPVCSAVAAVHERGIIHRDLKPDNVFLWQPIPGQVHPKLLDFGIAKLRTEGMDQSLTSTGAMLGTPKYMPPEQWASSKHTTPQSDQWALAVILYECLSATVPFEAEEMHGMVLKVATEPPRPLREVAPEVPEAFERALMRCLEKDASRRYPSVRDFARALLPFASAEAQARWGTDFRDRVSLEMASTINVPAPSEARGNGGTSGAAGAAGSRTLDRSGTELDAPSAAGGTKRSWGARAAGVAVVLGLVGAVVVSAAGLLRGGGAGPSATSAGAAMHATTQTPVVAVHHDVPRAPSVQAVQAVPVVPVVQAPPVVPVVPAAPVVPVMQATDDEPRAHRRSRRHHRGEIPAGGTNGEIPNF